VHSRDTRPEPGLKVEWRARPTPLVSAAVLARDDAARRLAARALSRPDEALIRLSALAAPALLVLLGESAELPWTDGARYFGRDRAAPSILMPTTLGPDLPPELLERAILAAPDRRGGPPFLVMPAADGLEIAPLGGALPLSRARLEAWLER
jgi:hypothetical protein